MRKIICLGVMAFLLSGCSMGEDINCTVDGKDAVFTLKDGIVSKYVLDGSSVSQSEVDEINGTYFTSATNNEEGKKILENYVSSMNGRCE